MRISDWSSDVCSSDLPSCAKFDSLGTYNFGGGGTMRNISRLMRSTRAATAVEYGLILPLVFLEAVGALSQVGTEPINMCANVSDASAAAMYGAGWASPGPVRNRQHPRPLWVRADPQGVGEEG